MVKMNSENIKNNLKSSCAILDKYKWLIDLYVLDFYVDKHWSRISSTWREFFQDVTPKDLAFLIDLECDEEVQNLDKVWPLEILAIKAAVKAYSLKRKPWTRQQVSTLLNLGNENKNWPGEFPTLEKVFRKHIKPKKQHEILIMGEVATMTKKAPGIIDVGGGVGHLSRLLSFGLDFQVTCLEAEGQFGTKALKIDEDLLKATKEKEEKRPKHVTLTVDPGLDVATFDEKFSGKHGIVGLHTCGDLGPTLVRLFAQSSKIETLQSVGCCYMHIRKCFPLSQNLQNFDLSYTSMELACHAIETYKDRLSNFEELEKLKVHNRRALLELILFEKNPELRKSMLKTVKNSHQMPFSEYVLKATEKLEKFDITSEDLENEDIQAKEMQWLRVVSFYTLRLLFAPLLETVLLLDRCLYLHENNLNCLLIPIFNPRLSPRNFVILSHK